MGLLVTLFLILVNTYSSTLATAPPIKVTRIKTKFSRDLYVFSRDPDWLVNGWSDARASFLQRCWNMDSYYSWPNSSSMRIWYRESCRLWLGKLMAGSFFWCPAFSWFSMPHFGWKCLTSISDERKLVKISTDFCILFWFLPFWQNKLFKGWHTVLYKKHSAINS